MATTPDIIDRLAGLLEDPAPAGTVALEVDERELIETIREAIATIKSLRAALQVNTAAIGLINPVGTFSV